MNYRNRYSYRRYSLSVSSFEVTPREIIFSVFIIGILYTIGFFISDWIGKKVDADNLKYRQAVHIVDNGEELKHAIDTDVGYAFVEGDFKTVDTVTWEGLEGDHLSIRMDKEEYRMHTRTVTYTDSNGKTKTKTKTYWTWDCVDSDYICAKRITLCGNEYGTSSFDFSEVSTKKTTKETGWHKRNVFYYKPKMFHGSIFCELMDGGVKGKPCVWEGWNLDQLRKYCTTSHKTTIFWVFWWILIIVVVFGFVAIDNKWLERSGRL